MPNTGKIKRIFLVDDEPLILGALHRVLKQEGYDTTGFPGPSEALAALENSTPDCIISDYYMPVTDGLTFLKEVKSLYPDIARVLLTGGHIDERINQALEQETVQILIQKPWHIGSIRELMEGVESGRTKMVVKNHEINQEVATAVNLPLDQDNIVAIKKHQTGPTILVVDDDLAFLELMKVWLTRLGYNPLVSPAAEQALDLSRQNQPDLMIVDLIMPSFSGFQLMSAMSELHPSTPIIGITGVAERDSAIEAFRVGATAFLHKPLELDTLEVTIRRCLQFGNLVFNGSSSQELSAMVEMQHAISSGMASHRLLHLMLQQMIRYTRADAASVMLVDEDRQSMKIAASYGLDEEVVKTERINISDGIAGWVVKNNEPQLIVGEAPHEFREDGRQRSKPATVGMCLPLRGPKDVLGALSVTRFEGEELFTKGALDLGLLLGAEVARVISKETAVNAQLTMERNMMRHDKLVTIGELASGVAHEINNPLGYVSSNVASLRDYIEDLVPILQNLTPGGTGVNIEKAVAAAQAADLEFILSDLRVCVGETMEGVKRVLKIAADLKAFAREDDVLMEKGDLNQIFDSAVGILWNQIKCKAELIREYSELPEVQCFPSQLGQVLLNLLYNAAQSIERDGRIIVRTRVADKWIVAEVEDNGHGMDRETVAQIFDPFFTTKPRGVGTGLGLSIAKKIIKRHNGKISVESAEGRGSHFVIEIPIKQADQGEE
ncbi:MAG: response regulator [Deltaproteobacteria bacterium]|nr:response regulator [Deltaproteobacteria bacterium]